jgi:DnaK suppressor protein
MSGRTDLDRAVLRATLEARRAELERHGEGEAGKTGTVPLDQQTVGRLSRIDALQGQEMALAQARRREAELTRIAAALARLDDDEYGYCAKCGEAIVVKRLELDPTVQTCIACAR